MQRATGSSLVNEESVGEKQRYYLRVCTHARHHPELKVLSYMQMLQYGSKHDKYVQLFYIYIYISYVYNPIKS